MFKGASVLGAGPRANLNGPFNHVKTFVLTFFFAMLIIYYLSILSLRVSLLFSFYIMIYTNLDSSQLLLEHWSMSGAIDI
jgi:hypothetical protein